MPHLTESREHLVSVVTVIDVKGLTVTDNPSRSDWRAGLVDCVLAVSATGVALDRQEQAQKTEKGSRLLLIWGGGGGGVKPQVGQTK